MYTFLFSLKSCFMFYLSLTFILIYAFSMVVTLCPICLPTSSHRHRWQTQIWHVSQKTVIPSKEWSLHLSFFRLDFSFSSDVCLKWITAFFNARFSVNWSLLILSLCLQVGHLKAENKTSNIEWINLYKKFWSTGYTNDLLLVYRVWNDLLLVFKCTLWTSFDINSSIECLMT